jgi:hypothetical protein
MDGSCKNLTADSSDDEYLLTPYMSHRSLRDFDKHGEHYFLKGETEIRGGDNILGFGSLAPRPIPPVRCVALDRGQYARQADVHSFGCVR